MPRTIYRLEAQTQALPRNMRWSSTHALGVAAALDLARALGQLPPRLIVYDVEGRSFTVGAELASEVERAIQQVLEHLRGQSAETQRINRQWMVP